MPEDLTLDYARAYWRRARLGRQPALVLIDFAMAYHDPGCPLRAGGGAVTALASTLRLRKAARRLGLPNGADARDLFAGRREGGRFWEEAAPLYCFVAGESTAGWGPGQEPRPEEIVIFRHYPSAFFGTALAPMLTRLGIDSVILTGLTTSGCGRAFCVETMPHGVITTVLGDACGDRHPEPHRADLFDMDAEYAHMTGGRDPGAPCDDGPAPGRAARLRATGSSFHARSELCDGGWQRGRPCRRKLPCLILDDHHLAERGWSER